MKRYGCNTRSTPSTCAYYQDEDDSLRTFSDPVFLFVARFDAGFYPELIDPERTRDDA